jgi:hypothetical protein
MVYLCNSVAAASPHVTVEIIDSDAFPDLVSRYKVGNVPKVVINEKDEVLDIVPAPVLIAKIAAAQPA